MRSRRLGDGVPLGSGVDGGDGVVAAEAEGDGCDERSMPQAASTSAAIPPPALNMNRRRVRRAGEVRMQPA